MTWICRCVPAARTRRRSPSAAGARSGRHAAGPLPAHPPGSLRRGPAAACRSAAPASLPAGPPAAPSAHVRARWALHQPHPADALQLQQGAFHASLRVRTQAPAPGCAMSEAAQGGCARLAANACATCPASRNSPPAGRRRESHRPAAAGSAGRHAARRPAPPASSSTSRSAPAAAWRTCRTPRRRSAGRPMYQANARLARLKATAASTPPASASRHSTSVLGITR